MLFEFFLVFVLAIIFVKIVQKYADRIGLVDEPNERSSHTLDTPSGAGIGFSLAIFSIIPLFYIDVFSDYTLIFLAIFLVFIIGVLDDIHDASPKTKFLVLILSTVFLIIDDFIIDYIGVYFGQQIYLGIFAAPFTLFAVVAFTNALNLIDGLDGLAGSVSVVIFMSFFIIGYQNNDLILMVISGSFISGLVAFLIFNYYPASIFMGDSGSLVLGFVIALLAIRSLLYIPAISILFITAIPILDTAIVVVRRKLNGKGLFTADKCHLHHIFYRFFSNNTKKTVLFFVVMQAGYSLTGLQFNKYHDDGLLLILFLLNVIMVYLFTDAMIKRQRSNCSQAN